MKTILTKIALAAIFLTFTLKGVAQESFEIRGVLPWHNFLSGPSAWNEKDYEKYLDECAQNNINFIGFHNYTGGGERYVTYVEPMIKISYKGIVPEAYFDNSLSARWGYLPLSVDNFTEESKKVLDLPAGAKSFGSDCSVLSKTKEEHYACSQGLMQKVLKMAHDRKMQMAMGFEFGVLPPEYFSLNMHGDCFYWRGEANMIPNPTHPISIDLHHAAIDNILETYPGIDWIWLWLNEHSFMGLDPKKAMEDPKFAEIFKKNAPHFPEAASDEERFIGVWAMEYMKISHEYLQKKGSKAKLILGGWGGSNQLPSLLKGLDRVLPKDIVFSCLNPNLGKEAQPEFLAEIAKNRKVWAVPWLEGDQQLWHFQPRMQMMQDQVKLAEKQNLHGVLAIHWRTAETKYNFKTFTHFASNPKSTKTTSQLYEDYFKAEMGDKVAKKLAPIFTKVDIEQIHDNIPSPEFYGYKPEWGAMDKTNTEIRTQICNELDALMKGEKDATKLANMKRFHAVFKFELLLSEVAHAMQPAYDLKRDYTRTQKALSSSELKDAYAKLTNSPVDEMIKTYVARVSSRGEMGVLSSINQRLRNEYMELKTFLEEQMK